MDDPRTFATKTILFLFAIIGLTMGHVFMVADRLAHESFATVASYDAAADF